MTRIAVLFLVLSSGLAATAALAHESHAAHAIGDAVVISLGAGHDGAPAQWRCTVLAPGGDEVWAEGDADRAGRFAFVPDRAGDWRVRAFAADGHGAEVTVAVDAEALALIMGEVDDHDHDHDHAPTPDHGHAVAGGGLGLKLAAGLGVLFGIFGVVALVQAKRG